MTSSERQYLKLGSVLIRQCRCDGDEGASVKSYESNYTLLYCKNYLLYVKNVFLLLNMWQIRENVEVLVGKLFYK